MIVYNILDWFFILFHTAFILFNVFAWIYKPLRKWNLIALTLTAVSWFILGIFFGIGYCFLTDLHWSILYKLEKCPIETSYIQYLFQRLLNISISANFADILTASVFFTAYFISIYVNIKAKLHKKSK